MKFASLVLLSSFLSLSAFANGSGGTRGGGDVLVCKVNGQRRVYLADTYELFRDAKLKSDESINQEIYAEALLRTIFESRPELKQQLREIESKIKTKIYFANDGLFAKAFPKLLGGHIKEIENDNLLPEGKCKKAQLAEQNIRKNLVTVEYQRWQAMSQMEQGIFSVHEIFINLRNATKDTTPVREEIKTFASDPRFLEQIELVRRESQTQAREKRVHFLALAAMGVDQGTTYALSNHLSMNAMAFARGYSMVCAVYGVQVDSSRVSSLLGDRLFRPGVERLDLPTAESFAEELVDSVRFSVKVKKP